MGFKEYREHKDEADKKRREKEFERAGNEYTIAAYEALGKSNLTGTADISRGLYCLMSAAVCYRLSDERRRGQNRCKQGILIAEDLRDDLFDDSLSRGAMWEQIGDFRTIGDLDGAKSAYETARKRYVSSGNPMEYICTEEFDATINIFSRLAEATGHELDWERFQSSQVERIDCKIAEFSSLLEKVLKESQWEYGEK